MKLSALVTNFNYFLIHIHILNAFAFYCFYRIYSNKVYISFVCAQCTQPDMFTVGPMVLILLLTGNVVSPLLLSPIYMFVLLPISSLK